MVVLTSIFIAEIKSSASFDRKRECEDLQLEERKSVLEEAKRELIGMYQGKNRVEPME